jgi:hypothetical protein
VQRIHDLHSHGLSLRQIATDLQARGLYGRQHQPISPKTVRAILRRAGAKACAARRKRIASSGALHFARGAD